jgi:hypothetical protein
MNETLIAEGWNATITWIHGEAYIYNVTDSDPFEFTLEENEEVNITVTVIAPSSASADENITLKINLRWYSWGTNDLGDVVKRTRRTHEEIKISVE